MVADVLDTIMKKTFRSRLNFSYCNKDQMSGPKNGIKFCLFTNCRILSLKKPM